MNTDQALILWNTRWALVAGMVVCGECRQGQSLTQSNQPFEHEPGCGNVADAGTQPWADLHDMLDRERG